MGTVHENKYKFYSNIQKPPCVKFKKLQECLPTWLHLLPVCMSHSPGKGGGGTPHNGLYLEAPPKRTFLRLAVYKRAGFSRV